MTMGMAASNGRPQFWKLREKFPKDCEGWGSKEKPTTFFGQFKLTKAGEGPKTKGTKKAKKRKVFLLYERLVDVQMFFFRTK
jgi:hypothetical protein